MAAQTIPHVNNRFILHALNTLKILDNIFFLRIPETTYILKEKPDIYKFFQWRFKTKQVSFQLLLCLETRSVVNGLIYVKCGITSFLLISFEI